MFSGVSGIGSGCGRTGGRPRLRFDIVVLSVLPNRIDEVRRTTAVVWPTLREGAARMQCVPLRTPLLASSTTWGVDAKAFDDFVPHRPVLRDQHLLSQANPHFFHHEPSAAKSLPGRGSPPGQRSERAGRAAHRLPYPPCRRIPGDHPGRVWRKATDVMKRVDPDALKRRRWQRDGRIAHQGIRRILSKGLDPQRVIRSHDPRASPWTAP